MPPPFPALVFAAMVVFESSASEPSPAKIPPPVVDAVLP